MINYVARRVALLGVIGLFGMIIFYVVWPNLTSFKNNSLSKQISLEVNSSDKQPVPIIVGGTTVNFDLAVSDDEKTKGLGGMSSLDDNKGMLFVFDTPSYPAMWMKDMLFPIDIAWVDSDFKIVDIQKNVSPTTYPESFQPQSPAKYVIEVNSGFFDAHNVTVGSILTLADSGHL